MTVLYSASLTTGVYTLFTIVQYGFHSIGINYGSVTSADTSAVWSGSELASFFHYNQTGEVTLNIKNGNYTGTGFNWIKIGTTQFNRTSAIVPNGEYVAAAGSSPAYTRWRWTANNPFGTSGSRTVQIDATVVDTQPNAFTFNAANNVNPSTTQTSNNITIAGMDAGQTVTASVSGGTMQKNSAGSFVSTNLTATNGDTFRLRHTSSSSFEGQVSTTLSVGSPTTAGTFTSTVRARDLTPDAPSWTDESGINPNVLRTSNTYTSSGMDAGPPYSVANITTTTGSGGQYSLNGGAWTNIGSPESLVSIDLGSTLQLRLTSNNNYGASHSITTNIGGASDTWTVTTRAASTTVNAYDFTDKTGVNPNTWTNSDVLTPTGHETAVPLTFSNPGNAQYRINGGTWTNVAATTLAPGQSLQLRLYSSALYSTNRSLDVNVGGTTDTFNVTTRAADVTPDAFDFGDSSGVEINTWTPSPNTITVSGIEAAITASFSGSTTNAQYSKNGGAWTNVANVSVSNGDTMRLRKYSSGSYSTALSVTMSMGGVSNEFTVTTRAGNTVPNAYTWTDTSGMLPGSGYSYSQTITLAGTEINTTCTFNQNANSNYQYSYQGGAWTNCNGATGITMAPASTLRLRINVASSFLATRSITTTIGGVADTFSAQTVAEDITPDAFSFTATTGADPSTIYESNEITVAGMNSTATVSVSAGGELSKDGGAWQTANTTAVNGTKLKIRRASSSAFQTLTQTTLTVGGTAATWNLTTRAGNTVPLQYSYTDVTGINPSTWGYSNILTPAAIEVPVTCTFSVTGNASYQYSINGGAYANCNGGTGVTLQVADTIRLRIYSGTYDAVRSLVTYITGVQDTFSVTTRSADVTPDAFDFTDVSGVELSTWTASNTLTPAGYEIAIPVTYSGATTNAQYSLAGGAWTNVGNHNISPGQSLQVRKYSSNAYSTGLTLTTTIGGVADNFTVTTRAGNTVPNAYTWTDVSGVLPSSGYQYSQTITLAGTEINTTCTFNRASSSLYQYSYNGGAYANCNGATGITMAPGSTLKLRITAAGAFSTERNIITTIGGVADTFSVTTVAEDTTPDAFTWTDVAGVELNALTESGNTITITGMNSTAAVSVTNGEYSKDGGAWTSAAGTAVTGSTFKVRRNASGSYSTGVSVTLNVGGVSDACLITTRAGSTTVNAYTWTDVSGVEPSAWAYSQTHTFSGSEINVGCTFSVLNNADYQYSYNGGAWTTPTNSIVIAPGSTLRLRIKASATYNAVRSQATDVNGVADTFSVTTRPPDTSPDAVDFGAFTGLEPNGAYNESNIVTIGGIEAATAFTYSQSTGMDAQWRKDGGAWTTGQSTIANGQTLQFRAKTSTNFSTLWRVSVLFNNEFPPSYAFDLTTRAPIVDAAAFTFTDLTDRILASTSVSNEITVAGLEATATVTVSGDGAYIKNGGASATVNTTAVNGDKFKLTHQNAAAFSTSKNTTLSIGATQDTFTSTTQAEDTTPDAFDFTNVDGADPGSLQTSANEVTILGMNSTATVVVANGELSKNSGAYTNEQTNAINGDKFRVRGNASNTYGGTKNVVLTVGGTQGTFTITTRAANLVPNAFDFVDKTGVALGANSTSAGVVIGGLEAATTISVSGGWYSLDGTNFTTTAGSFPVGGTVYARVTASGSFSTAKSVTVTIGGVAADFTATTVAEDAVPAAFNFTTVDGAEINTAYESNEITLTGINTTVTIDPGTNSWYSKNGAAYTDQNGTAVNGDKFKMRVTTGSAYSTMNAGLLQIKNSGGTLTALDAFIVITKTVFNDATDVALNAYGYSNTVTIQSDTWNSIDLPISIAGGGQYSKNGGAYTSTAGTLTDGDTVRIRRLASGSYATTTNTTVTIGNNGVSDTFSVTTIADTTPDAFSFDPILNAQLNTTVEAAAPITVAGITASTPVAISASGLQYEKNNSGTWTSAAGTVVLGDVVSVRLTTPNTLTTDTTGTLTIGGVSADFTVTTRAGDITPDPFTFNPVPAAALNTQYTSNTITVNGVEGSVPVTHTGNFIKKNSGGYSQVQNLTAVNGDTFTLRRNSGTTYDETVYSLLTVGDTTRSWAITTSAAPPGYYDYGAIVYDASGKQTLAITDRTVFLIERSLFSIPGNGGSQTKNYPVPVGNIVFIKGHAPSNSWQGYDLRVTISGNSVTIINNETTTKSPECYVFSLGT